MSTSATTNSKASVAPTIRHCITFLVVSFLTGKIPSFGSCVNLTRLLLSENNLSGDCVTHTTCSLSLEGF
jgi:hypothetical protein